MRLGKVYYDLNESDYIIDYKRFKFIFSSKFYIEKFKKELYNYINIEQNRIDERYKLRLESSEYLALSLYKKIEKRGFLVYFNGRKIDKNQTFTISLSILNII